MKPERDFIKFVEKCCEIKCEQKLSKIDSEPKLNGGNRLVHMKEMLVNSFRVNILQERDVIRL